ncbi:MAG: TlpA family protein disulfide reductase [Bacteroidetes bacterium]|nr:TlpA family protein disulfide reductase [Bacteroidota bacterium]MBU1116000.1 TlpA family protein disulfide reductase [Bacteroidota bacterium]MBU1799232.1 TlpA family protein disulfide reductase [Bacteroidota bacterium]
MKKNLIIPFIFFVLLSNLNMAQNISIVVENSSITKASVQQLEGEKVSIVDTVISPSGDFRFSLDGKHNGFYRLQMDSKHWIDFINDGIDVEIRTDFNSMIDSLQIVKSESNKLYYNFMELSKAYKTKTELLNLILVHYPNNDDYYQTTKTKLLQTKEEYIHFVEVTSQKNPKSFTARYIKAAQLPIVPELTNNPKNPYEDNNQLKFLKSHALDKVDFNDFEMIYSNLFANKSIEYLTYYRNQQLPKQLLEQEFMKAVDTLLNKAKVNDLVYQQMTEYLIDGFTKFGFDAIINYIVDNYVIKDDLCLDSQIESTIQRRIDQSKYLKIGNVVPKIVLPDSNGNNIDLSKIESEKILILFYASWCPHCKTTVTELIKLYNNQKQKKVEILAVSLDENRTEWLKFIKSNKLDWLNVSDLKGWNGKAIEEYFIYATPTMFFVDSKRNIISKPLTIDEIKSVF